MSVDLGTIIEDLLSAEDQKYAAEVAAIQARKTLSTARVLILQLRQENYLLKAENAELRHHLNPAPADPLTEAEAPY